MKKNSIIILVSALTLGVFVTACNKSKEGCTDPVATNYDSSAKTDDGSCVYPEATLEISNPVKGSMFHNGETVNIKAVANNYEVLHGWKLYLLNTTTGDTVFQDNKHDHATELNIESSWVSNITQHADMELGITVVIDHDGHEITKKVTFMCMP